MFDFDKLRGRIKEVFGSEKAFAEAMGIAPSGMSARLNGSIYFDSAEMHRAKELLGITDEEFTVYFFTVKVR